MHQSYLALPRVVRWVNTYNEDTFIKGRGSWHDAFDGFVWVEKCVHSLLKRERAVASGRNWWRPRRASKCWFHQNVHVNFIIRIKFLERAWCFCEARLGWAHGPRWADKCSLVAPPKNVPQSHSDRPAVRWSRCWRDWFWLRLDCDGDNIAWVTRFSRCALELGLIKILGWARMAVLQVSKRASVLLGSSNRLSTIARSVSFFLFCCSSRLS